MTNDAERVSDIVAELAIKPAGYRYRGGDGAYADAWYVSGGKPPVIDGITWEVEPLYTADIIEAQSKALAEAREALKPFADGSLDVSGSAVIIGYPEASTALVIARALLTPTPENPNG